MLSSCVSCCCIPCYFLSPLPPTALLASHPHNPTSPPVRDALVQLNKPTDLGRRRHAVGRPLALVSHARGRALLFPLLSPPHSLQSLLLPLLPLPQHVLQLLPCLHQPCRLTLILLNSPRDKPLARCVLQPLDCLK